MGYPENEILGRNCRFLQHPPQRFAERAESTTHLDPSAPYLDLTEDEDNDGTSTDTAAAAIKSQVMMQNYSARLTIKECVANSVEGQASFINYRYDGERFWNLLSVIPIENGGKNYFVGLQADLGPVEGLRHMVVG